LQGACDNPFQGIHIMPARRFTLGRIGLIGHRQLRDDPETESIIRQQAQQRLATWRERFARVEVYSPLSIGADQVLVDVALELGCSLVAVVPFADFETEFAEEDRQRYHALLQRAAAIVTLPEQQRSRAAFRLAGEWIVDHTDRLLAVWNGRPARSEGGTAETVAYARAQHKPVTVIPLH
jgi:uncharacterized phage-like protein YoqJ